MPTRAEEQRETLVRDVKDAARAQLREVGAEALSLRAIARDVGMSPAGLYRYFDGRDAILTALIEEGFDDLADHLFHALGQEEFVLARHGRPRPDGPVAPDGAGFREQQRAVARAYRRWSLDHPNEFGLLYGDPVRGYAAPEDGVTVAANTRVSQAMLTAMVGALAAGQLRVPAHYAALADDPGGRRLAADIEAIAGVDVGAGTALRMIGAWARLHGLVSLEVFNQLHWLYPTDAQPFADVEIEAQLDDVFA
jgi:AcrR family transcriptional regulator